MYEKLEKITNDSKFSLFMLLSIIAYASLKFSYRSIADIFQTIFLLGFILCMIVDKTALKRNQIFKILLLSLAFPIFSWINSKIYLPELAHSKPSLSNAINLFYFLPIAYLIKRNRKHIWFIWLAFSIGLIFSVFHYSPSVLEQIKDAINGKRVDFGFYNLQHASAWAGACIIIFIGVFFKLIYTKKTTSIILLSIASTPFWFIFMATQTRQTFLGLFIALFLTLIFYFLKLKVRKSYIFSCTLSLVLISTITFNYSGVKERTIKEIDNYSEILEGNYTNFKNAQESSSIRFSLWYAGYQWVKEYPIFGSDREISEYIIETSPFVPEASRRANHNHLHSYYVELAVSYGLVGLVVILSLFLCIYLNVLNREEDNQFNEIQFVGLVFIPYWMIVNIFEPHLLTPPGQLIHNVMIGTFFFFSMKNNSQETRV